MEKEVRFTEKKIDQAWKESKGREKEEAKAEPGARPALSFSTLLTSLGYQTLMHLGEFPHPDTQERRLDLDAAKETIDLLALLESKTEGNRTPEEDKLLKNLLAELRMKFVEKAAPL